MLKPYAKELISYFNLISDLVVLKLLLYAPMNETVILMLEQNQLCVNAIRW